MDKKLSSVELKELIQDFSMFSEKFLLEINSRRAGVINGMGNLEYSTLDYNKSNGVKFAMDQFVSRFNEHISGSTGPRYFGFVTGGVSPAALLGDWVVSTIDQNVVINGESFASSLEHSIISDLIQYLKLGSKFSGAFVTGATMSNFVGLSLAREWIGEERGVNVSKLGVSSLGEVKVLSALPHSSISKCLSMLGLGRDSLIQVKSIEGRESIDLNDLENKMASINGPFIVVCNFGTVTTTDFDDLVEVAKLKQKYNFWIHLDAAFGGWVKLSKKYSHLTEGMELADSITLDCHKWLNVPYDCGLSLTKRKDLQYKVFQNNADYIKINEETNLDFVNLTPENSRRFRALPVWFVLMAYGTVGIEKMIDGNCEISKYMGFNIKNSKYFVLLREVTINVVLFTIDFNKYPSFDVNSFIKKVNEKGVIFITPASYQNRNAIRICISNWRTTHRDADLAMLELNNTFKSLI